jgi:hypothetical protein
MLTKGHTAVLADNRSNEAAEPDGTMAITAAA